MHRNRKRQLKFIKYIMGKEGLDNLTLTGNSESKKVREKWRLTNLAGLCEWLAEQEVERIVRKSNIAKSNKR